MKTARVHAFGEDLRIDEVPEPEPEEDEALLDVRYIGVNPLDVWLTQGTVAGGRQPLPFVPGVEAAGIIQGRWVLVHGEGLGTVRDGLYRERAAVPRQVVLPIPEGVDPKQAAAMGVAGVTAWRLVHETARIRREDRVLVLGASGGVGSLVLQLVRAAGAAAWAQTTSEEKVGFLRELGAERAVVTGPGGLVAAMGDDRPTVVIDPLGDAFTTAAIEILEPFGREVLYGASAGSRADMDLRTLYRKAVRILTYSGTIEPGDRLREGTHRALDALARGEMWVPIDDVLPLDEAAEAHRRITERRVRGKLLLAP